MNTDKLTARMAASILSAYGVTDIVLSPGSRNAPLISAFASDNTFATTIIADERMAAFVALGLSAVSQKPTAVVCTSGSAVLNYGPAAAEAFYEGLPLIFISADRPSQWIDQMDSQTIRQSGALSNVVKASYNIADVSPEDTDGAWYARRTLIDAMMTTLTPRRGPVHINMQFDVPLYGETEEEYHTEIPDLIRAQESIETNILRQLAEEISCHRVMVVCGAMSPSYRINKAIGRLAGKPNIAVIAEITSNIHSPKAIFTPDLTISSMSDTELSELQPDIIITLGGAIVSGTLKKYLRKCNCQHWHIGKTDSLTDTYKHISRRIDLNPDDVLPGLAHTLNRYPCHGNYSELWGKAKEKSITLRDNILKGTEWSDISAIDVIMKKIPRNWNVHFSNGMTIRYAQLFGERTFHSIHCNRGVSGIDGCTSTALGASLNYKGTTLLVTGDMSLAYDITPILSNLSDNRFKIIVINNGGGNIFRSIASTKHNPHLERCFVANPEMNFVDIARAGNFATWEASDSEELGRVLLKFMAEKDRPALLQINTVIQGSHSAWCDFLDKIR